MGYDLIGSIAVVKFKREVGKKEKLNEAKKIIGKNIKTILEKTEKVKGRLRTIKTKFIAGENTKETIHKENGCRFKLNVESCYFSPRLAEERKEIAGKIKKDDRVLVMFAGVGPFSIVIAKKSRAKEIISVELGRECCKYAEENNKLNKIRNIKIIQGDVKKKVNSTLGRFDKIIMPRPNLKESFLEPALSVSRKGTIIYYYGFCEEHEIQKLIEELKKEAESKKKIEILNVKKAGDIAPFRYRYRIEIKVLN